MIRRQRPTFSSAELQLQLQQVSVDKVLTQHVADTQVTLDATSSGAENLEALAPLIKSIQDTDSEQIYLRSLDKFVEEKEGEIEKICSGNYEVGTEPKS
jgi:predicted HAD superfamily phosphohydrolase